MRPPDPSLDNPPIPTPTKRKKWTEAEERTLLDKYAEMSRDGSLTRLRTRERRFRPIASHVNSLHHLVDPSSYPFFWSWKDASTKVQNMRHQYSHVKNKLLLPHLSDPPLDPLSLWPNFHRYRDVFGDAVDSDEKSPPPPLPPSATTTGSRSKRRRKGWAVVMDRIQALREREERLATAAAEEEEEEREEESRWEEEMETRRSDWRRRIEGAMAQHRAEMEEMRTRALHDQQALLGQLLAVAAQCCGFAPGDAAALQQQQSHQHNQQPFCFSQMVQQQQHHHHHHQEDGGMEDHRVTPVDSQDEGDQFIVDDSDAPPPPPTS